MENDYSKLVWTENPPFLFGRYRINGQFDPDSEEVYATLLVKPAGAGSRVEWGTSPANCEGTFEFDSIAITSECAQEQAIAQAKEAAIDSCQRWIQEQGKST